ncbi:MAG: hypothetical protein R3B13_32800 [Polyangiaceae bacterium]
MKPLHTFLLRSALLVGSFVFGCAETELTGSSSGVAGQSGGAGTGTMDGGAGVSSGGALGDANAGGSGGGGGTAGGAGFGGGGGFSGASGAGAGAGFAGAAGVSGGTAGVGGTAGSGGTVGSGGASSGGAIGSGGSAGIPNCVDYQTNIQTIFNTRCIDCHSGPFAPQNLHLDSYAGVMAGGLTGNEVVACQSAASLLYMKISMANPPVGERMPADGPPYLDATQIETIKRWIDQGARTSCSVPDPCTDTVPPTFGGVTSATVTSTQVGVNVCWAAGSDNTTAAAKLVYDVWSATTPGGQNFSGPALGTSPAGATCMAFEGLTPGQQYCFVARARDEAGNRDANTVQKCVTLPAASCVDFNTMVLPIFKSECTHCHSGPNPPQNLKLDSYAGVIAGGNTGNEVIACQPDTSLLHKKIALANPPIGARMPADGPPYLTTTQIGIIDQWIAEGARSSCAAPDPCSNTTPPTFAGINSASVLNATTARLCWAAASDDATPASGIVYDIYQAGTPKGQNFSSPSLSSGPGQLCVDVDALSPQSQYCWVVRARDGAGNSDANTVEKCLTLPAVPAGCVDYDTMIQPLLDKNCVRCHSKPLPPQWLTLDSYEGLIAGGARRNEVTACNPGASLLINKVSANPSVGKRMPYDGPPYLTATQIAMLSQWVTNGAQRSCAIAANCSDSAAPTFGGIKSATPLDASTIQVCWNAATDAGTQAQDIRYDIYEATQSKGQAYNQPPQHSVVGQVCADVKVGPSAQLCFVVRARDLRGNRDQNQAEICVSAPAASCDAEFDADIQPILAARCAFCHSGKSPGHFLSLKSYADLLAGGSLRNEVQACDWPGSLINQKTAGTVCGNRMPRDGPPWLAPSERSTLEAWVKSGARNKCTDPAVCGDTTKPVFAGVKSVQATSPTNLRVCWDPATDNATLPSALTYLVFEAANSGGQTFNRPASYAIAGANCIDVTTPVSTQSCYVVRARDLTGNVDGNTKQICASTPNGCFNYADLVQPIFDARCVHCHGGNSPPKGIRWESYAAAISTGDVEACKPGAGKLLEMVEGCEMPLDTTGACNVATACLTPSEQRILRQWINQGAAQNCPWPGCN